ncbi:MULTISPECIES: hypothetical protein [unclassified Sphingobium]|uniref:hypothetical protein n=1 Tax=unclassified Sphingobium TaxID=2611147 RepID=UPI002223FDAA|nr:MULTISPECIES: hypothetical protein [unclassified Sphingobium]MCW2413448.1 hypothetical protein [Sphingobium sp. B8D3D]MCW2414253.1 hypothetical protein [Sphingobium sp. B8D3A]
MIEHLRAAKTANFHRLKKPLSLAAINGLFTSIRASHAEPSHNFFAYRRVEQGPAVWSAICFSYEQKPAFLADHAGADERVWGFLLLVEHRGHAAIFKSRFNLPNAFGTRYLGRVSAERVDAAIARRDAIFEKVRLRNLSVSGFAMRTKSYEANDLKAVVGPSGANRYAPLGYALRAGQDHYRTTPSTGRIALRSERIGHLELVDYAVSVIEELLDAEPARNDFIRTFARAVNLEEALETARPVAFAVDVASLAGAIHDARRIRLVRFEEGNFLQLSNVEIDGVLDELGQVLEIGDVAGKLCSLSRPGAPQDPVGAIALNKSGIGLRKLDLPLASDVSVEQTDYPLGADPNRLSLRRYIDKENGYIILFSDPALGYIGGNLFRDGAMAEGGDVLLRHLVTNADLDNVTDEKGTFAQGHTSFDEDSTFGVIVASVAHGDGILVCDDLGDEWADFIGLDNEASPPRISFYHGKHGPLSLGASPFHVSVSQAQKNLERMMLPATAMGGKINGWGNSYISGGGVHTAIPRVIRGDQELLAEAFEQARAAPDAIRRAMIVTSSLSKGAVEEALSEIRAGGRPDPYFIQLYQLLMSFFSACTEMNAFGYVVCRP